MSEYVLIDQSRTHFSVSNLALPSMRKSAAMLSMVLVVFLTGCISSAVSFNSSTDESSLLSIKSRITSDPNNVLATNWSEGSSFCTWTGVSCSPNPSRVVGLNLSNMGLEGAIAPEIGNLSFLTYLDISRNGFSGLIPDTFGTLSRLRVLDVSYNELSGHIPPSLGSLTNLRSLNVSKNNLVGSVPWSAFGLSSLQALNLSSNQFSGVLPRDICRSSPMLEDLLLDSNQFEDAIPSSMFACSQLRIIALSYNSLTGMLPVEIGNLSQLQVLYLGRNSLTGPIPSSIGNLSNLRRLDFGDNSFQGTLPSAMGRLSFLTRLNLQGNKLSGEVPLSLFNLSRLQTMSLARNNFSGHLPASMDQGLPNLEGLFLTDNSFSGSIPDSISNLSRLNAISLTYNFFSGYIPVNLGNLRNLEDLLLGANQFSNNLSIPEQNFFTSMTNCRQLVNIQIGRNPITGELPKSLNLSSTLEKFVAFSCKLSGTIPDDVSILSNLILFSLGDNNLTGVLPEGLGRLSNLQRLTLYTNQLDGPIPDSFCRFQSLDALNIFGNRLSGLLPPCLGNLSSLREIYLNDNRFNFTIPLSFWQNQDILVMDFSNNFITGSLPVGIGNAKSLVALYASGNQLTGRIPSTIGGLESLMNVSFSNNKLDGPIPESFARLRDLQLLDLSQNNLFGSIPTSLGTLSHLMYFNVSFNQLTGEIPGEGPFVNFTSDSFEGNRGLCGASRFNVQTCRKVSTKHSKRHRLLWYILTPIASIAILATIIVLFLIYRRRKSSLSSSLESPLGPMHERISYYEIMRSTNNLDEGNLIGKGGIGSVYKGEFSEGTIFAVKVFNLDLQGAEKTFETECNTMRSVRHRNLVKVITSCSNPDFKALVLEYMPNGNLDKWLYSPNCFLRIDQRLALMIDVAFAIEYLHQGHSSPIVHCDIKPNNILLNAEMVAHVGDFGIAKLLSHDQRLIQTKTLGTIGYMAPEYGLTGSVSTKVDIYSYGILLMETFTLKNPTSEMFFGDLTIKRWVFESFPDSLARIVDAVLLKANHESVKNRSMRCLTLILGLALECTSDLPQERPNINDVRVRLEKINSEYRDTE